MKSGRVILMMTILLVFCFSAFAEGFNVLVYPSNTVIERYLGAFFPKLPADAENAFPRLPLRLQLLRFGFIDPVKGLHLFERRHGQRSFP